jgi:chalcone isomerase-like protein
MWCRRAKKLFVIGVTLALAGSAGAREIEGMKLPERVPIGQTTLTLNGAGVRTKMLVKAYVGALYLQTPTNDGAVAVSSDQPKRVTLVLLRDLSRDKMATGLREGFQKNNSPEKLQALAPEMQKFEAFLQSGKRGDWMTLTYIPGRGTTATNSAGGSILIPGKDFADALYSIWLGPHPMDDGLKKAMLASAPGGA